MDWRTWRQLAHGGHRGGWQAAGLAPREPRQAASVQGFSAKILPLNVVRFSGLPELEQWCLRDLRQLKASIGKVAPSAAGAFSEEMLEASCSRLLDAAAQELCVQTMTEVLMEQRQQEEMLEASCSRLVDAAAQELTVQTMTEVLSEQRQQLEQQLKCGAEPAPAEPGPSSGSSAAAQAPAEDATCEDAPAETWFKLVPKSSAEDVPLVNGWKQCLAGARPYYYNEEARTVTWKRPALLNSINPWHVEGADVMAASGWKLWHVYQTNEKFWYHKESGHTAGYDVFAPEVEAEAARLREARRAANLAADAAAAEAKAKAASAGTRKRKAR
ncbi:unnamed protein product [Symbiodinium sp. CCMP2592]|nr:unnamed protein product [Symbiodinium sp. CCMP2592]